MLNQKKLISIPQFLDTPISWEYQDDKVAMGSYKATDCLLGLLEFCAGLFLRPHAFGELKVEELVRIYPSTEN